MRSFISFVFSSMMLGCCSLLAQQEERSVKFRILCYEHSNEILKGKVDGDGDKGLEVDFFTGGFGPQLTGRFRDGKARFFVDVQGADGKPARKIVAEGNLVASAVQMFLLFPQNKGDSIPYKILAFDDLEKSFPMGATRVLNLAPFPVRLNLAGADMAPIKPGGMQVYPHVKQVDDWNMYTARIDFGPEGDKWIPVATQSWKASERKRDWVITHIDPETKSPAVRLYQDIPPWREVQLPVNGEAP